MYGHLEPIIKYLLMFIISLTIKQPIFVVKLLGDLFLLKELFIDFLSLLMLSILKLLEF
jgi:hypothetical protein